MRLGRPDGCGCNRRGGAGLSIGAGPYQRRSGAGGPAFSSLPALCLPSPAFHPPRIFHSKFSPLQSSMTRISCSRPTASAGSDSIWLILSTPHSCRRASLPLPSSEMAAGGPRSLSPKDSARSYLIQILMPSLALPIYFVPSGAALDLMFKDGWHWTDSVMATDQEG